jgi:hypothetical protein
LAPDGSVMFAGHIIPRRTRSMLDLRGLRVLLFALLFVWPAAASAQYTEISIEEIPAEDEGDPLDSLVHISVGAGFGHATEADVSVPALEESVAIRLMRFESIASLFIGAALVQSWESESTTRGNYTWWGLDFFGRFGSEIAIISGSDFSLLAVPFVHFGLRHAIIGGPDVSWNDSAFAFGAGAEARAVFLDGLLGVFVRPLQFNFLHIDAAAHFSPQYVFLAGAQIRL